MAALEQDLLAPRGPCGRGRRAPPSRRPSKNSACRRLTARSASASVTTNERFTSEAPNEIITTLTCAQRLEDARGERRPGARSRVPTTLTIAMLAQDAHLAELAPCRPAIAAARSASSTVSEIDTSDVATRSTERVVALEDLEDARQEAVRHEHARLRDQHDRDALLGRDRARLAQQAARGPRRSSVPGARRVQRVQDAHRDAALDRGLDRRGVQHLGAEVGQLGGLLEATSEMTRAAGTTRGSAVSMPSTSVQIWISSAAARRRGSRPTSRSRRGRASS